MKGLLKKVAIAAVVFSVTGCASMYLGKTTASFETPAGLKANYESNKNQENFSVTATIGEDGKITGVDIKTTATTPEAAMAAALSFQTELLRQLMPLIQKAAALGAGS